MDLINRLGRPYKLTEYGRKISPDVRIIYNSSRLSLLDQGSKQLDNEKATSGPRFVAWAIFKDRTDGRKFPPADKEFGRCRRRH